MFKNQNFKITQQNAEITNQQKLFKKQDKR